MRRLSCELRNASMGGKNIFEKYVIKFLIKHGYEKNHAPLWVCNALKTVDINLIPISIPQKKQ